MQRRFLSLLCVALVMGMLHGAQTVAETSHQVVEGVGGVPLHVVSAGSPENPSILFVHGMGQSHYVFHRQFDSALVDDYFLVSFDLRGHGASGKPWDNSAYGTADVWAGDVAAVLAATGATQPLIVGWSYGSLVALDYFRLHGPDAVPGMVLTGAIGALLPFRLPPDDGPDVAEFKRVREQQFSSDPREQVAASQRMVDWLTSSEIDPAEREVLRSTTMMFPAYARRAIYSRALDNQDLLPALSEIPVLLALGADDNPVMLEDAALLAARDGVSLSLYKGAGHSVFMEQPQRFNDELSDFASLVFSAAAAKPAVGGRR